MASVARVPLILGLWVFNLGAKDRCFFSNKHIGQAKKNFCQLASDTRNQAPFDQGWWESVSPTLPGCHRHQKEDSLYLFRDSQSHGYYKMAALV